MSSVNRGAYPPVSPERCEATLGRALPVGALRLIFSCLDNSSLQRVAWVSRGCCCASKALFAKRLSVFLAHRLDSRSHSHIKNKLLAIRDASGFPYTESSLEVRSASHAIHNEIAWILMSLTSREVTSLEAVCRVRVEPKLLDRLLRLAKVHQGSSVQERARAYTKLFEEFLEVGRDPEALAEIVVNTQEKGDLLLEGLTVACIQKGLLGGALAETRQVSDEKKRDGLLITISKAFEESVVFPYFLDRKISYAA
ncbi:MAG: hypothetical protein S4CHLAM2_17660 [Chlamydiales bacterium]|nr:hypothetical protein [Chlamydiales bacterium]